MTNPNGEHAMPDPLTELAGAAVGLHEMYSELVAAGFLPDQALYLIGQQLQSAGKGGTS